MDDVEDAVRTDLVSGLVIEVVRRNLALISGQLAEGDYEEAIENASAQVRDDPGSLIAHLGLFGAIFLDILANEHEDDPWQLLQEIAPLLHTDRDERH
jgi:hypothetical protein